MLPDGLAFTGTGLLMMLFICSGLHKGGLYVRVMFVKLVSATNYANMKHYHKKYTAAKNFIVLHCLLAVIKQI